MVEREGQRGGAFAQLAVFAVVATGALIATAFALYVFWLVPGTLGLDLPAYTEAAARLLATGSPYSAEIHYGPLEHLVVNIPVNYVYPPPVAQAFVVLRIVPFEALAILWTASQWVLLSVALIAVDRRFSGRTDARRAALIVLATAALHPVQVGLYIGGVSGWVAILVSLVLVGAPAVRGVAANVAAIVKVIPGALVVGAFLDPESRRQTMIAGMVLLAVSFIVSPYAWVDFFVVLPSLIGMPAAVTHANYSPAYILSTMDASLLSAITRYALPALFLALTVINALRSERLAWVAAAAGVYLTATVTSWQQYFVALVPIVVAAWPTMSGRLRAVVLATWVWYSFLWFGSELLIHRLVGSALWLMILFSLAGAPLARSVSLFKATQPINLSGVTAKR